MSNRAWVTLATNDSYGLGALVLAHSLRRVGSTYPAVVLITPSVTDSMRDRLRAVFAEVVTVDVLDSRDAAHLALLQRPELGITFTKIHCWNLTQYEKCVFLDADALVVQNCDELFEREELSAAPDVGWPDCFNSGVFVYTPSADTFNRLLQFAQDRGSFDGGDQGLLNSFFSDWAHGDINKHLPFLYNVTSAAFYSYMPALKHYGQNLKIIHFIGPAKPWLQHFNWESRVVDAPEHLRQFLQLWWDLFVADVHSQLDVSMSGVAGNFARVTLGSTQREAIDELTRRQGWEAGNIDYMGVDSFDNIWAKISQTLSQARPSPPKQSPPREAAPPQIAPEQVEVQTGEIAQEPVTDSVEVAKEVVPSKEPIQVQKPEVKTPVASTETASIPTQTPVQIESAVQSKTVAPTETLLTKTSPTIEADVTAEISEPASISAAKEVPSTIPTQSVSEVQPETLPLKTPESVTATEPSAKVVEQAPISKAPISDKPPVTVSDAVTAEVTHEAPEVITPPAVIETLASEIPVSVEAVKSVKIPSAVTVPEVEPVIIECKDKTEATPKEPVADSVKVPSAGTKSQSDPVQEVIKEKTEGPVTKTAPVEPVAVPVKVPSANTAPSAEPTLTKVVDKTETPITKTIPVEPVAETPKVEKPVQAAQTVPAEFSVCPVKSTPEKSVTSDSASDSPPLANTPSKEEIPDVTAAKSTEEAAQETRL